MPTTCDWMSAIPNPETTRLMDIVMPGSHDAGAGGQLDSKLGMNDAWSRCQYGDFSDQLRSGSRFFDCRVFLQANLPVKDDSAGRKKMRLGHFAWESPLKKQTELLEQTGLFGAYGVTLKSAIQHSVNFLEDYSHETVILRFTHSGAPDMLCEAIKHWRAKYPRWRDRIYCFSGNIALHPMICLRGRLVMVFDGKHTMLNCREGLHKFTKLEETGGNAVDAGLCCCGKFGKSSNISVVMESVGLGVNEHFNAHRRDHLHFVYYQQTMEATKVNKSIRQATNVNNKFSKETGEEIKYTGGARDNMKNLAGDLRTMASKMLVPVSDLVNVISHDFVSMSTCKEIIELNRGILLD